MQELKLGLAGSEITLPTASRINNQGQDTFNYVQGFSADGTMSVDFIGTKRNFNITWDVLSEADFKIINDIYLLQLTGTFLSFIYTSENGTETTKTVFMTPPSRGDLIAKDTFYTNSVTIGLNEV